MTEKQIIILVAFGIYMLMMILIGALSSKNENNEDYFLGGRGLGSWTAALSAQASDMSGWLLMGLPGAIYVAGTGEVWIAIGLFIGTVLNWYLVARRLRKYTIVSNNSLTIPSFFENRFHDKTGVLKVVASLIIIVFFAVYTASAFSSGAKLFANVFGNTSNAETMYTIGLTVAALVILIYTSMGGFKAVCYTDFIQGILMLIAILAVPLIAYIGITNDYGSVSASLSAKGVVDPAGYLSLMKDSEGNPITAVSIISNLGWALGYFGMPHILIRFMAIRSDAEVKKSRVIAIAWVILSLGAASLLGVFARGFLTEVLDGSNSETVFIKTILQIFDGNFILIFIGGIFLCGILAAIMSTADSQLLVTASAVSEDMYKGALNKKASEKNALMVGKIAVVVVAIIAYIIALDPNSSIMGLVSNAWAGFGAAFGPVVLLSLFWKRFNLPGAVAGMATGAAFVIFWDYIKIGGETLGSSTGLYSLVIGFFLAALVAVIITLCTKAPSKEVIADFDKVESVEI
ncbi:MAG: sodium/proline symporter PutP [Ruminococcus sp.]|nr:sodium/proline symporter PutP [Ruminococcus sp.]